MGGLTGPPVQACDVRQLAESAAKLPCGMIGMLSFSAIASRSGAGVKMALARLQAALADRPIVLFAKAD